MINPFQHDQPVKKSIFHRIRKFLVNFFRKKRSSVIETEKVEKQVSDTDIVSQKESRKTGDEISKKADSDASQDYDAVLREASKKKYSQRKADRERRRQENERIISARQPSQKISKNGISILGKDDDLVELFTGKKSEKKSEKKPEEKPEEKPEMNFAEMFEKSLDENGDFQTILQEKEDSSSPVKALTVMERIKAYPDPEDEIDLHGYTAREAKAKTEIFIQNAHYKGIQTLRIIVGKGLHSQSKAVLPDIIEKKVACLKKGNLVLTFQWENRGKLKSGAMIVYLTQT